MNQELCLQEENVRKLIPGVDMEHSEVTFQWVTSVGVGHIRVKGCA